MVSPVNGLQQQIPAANTFQPGGADATKTADDNNKTDDTGGVSGSGTAGSRATSSQSSKQVQDTPSYQASNDDDRYQDSGKVAASSSRGTQLDISA